jgi:hypothetical protein
MLNYDFVFSRVCLVCHKTSPDIELCKHHGFRYLWNLDYLVLL